MEKTLKINEKDNVVINLDKTNGIKYGHKIALTNIKQGEYVFKYGQVIGRAKKDINKGDWVHSHNLESHLDQSFEFNYSPSLKSIDMTHKTFLGYKRKSRPAGIRNHIYIIPTVGCVNSVAKKIEEKAQSLEKGSVDDIFALTHPFGCSQLGEDHKNIKHFLASIALNPNASFVLFVGLGCENNSLQGIKDILEPYHLDYVKYFNCQDVEDDVEYGFNIIKEFVKVAKDYKRVEVDFSELTIGLKCGGSDAFSGITANPLVGKITDKVISFGGSAILTEVPEMFGAEQLLMNRCKDKETFLKYKKLIIDFKNYYTSLGFPVYENPSPGNKEGGITTLEEKSLGCITKGGSTPINGVLDYTEQIKENGLNVLNAPGNDLIASSALGASGAQIVLFTTGRGTPFSTFVPTLKISTNHFLAEHKKDWIDFDASTYDEEGLFKVLMDVISGRKYLKQEDSHEIAFFKKGVSL